MEPRSKKARFGEVSEDAELQALEARTPMSTKTATTFWLGVFESFRVEKEIVLDLKSCSASELDEVLGKFYLGLRMKNGERYKKASYLAARAAISRYMAVDLSKPTCNVFRQAEFQRSNNILDGVLMQAKASGEERAVEHNEAITADDLEKIRRYFDDVLDVGDPVKLTQFCWFHLSIHFALRSKEIQTTIRKSDIVFETDSEGKEYASLRRDFLAKNCPGGIKGREYESCGRLQEPRQVELEALEKLLAKLHPGVERLFQRGLKGNQPESKPTWFMKAPLGHTVLGESSGNDHFVQPTRQRRFPEQRHSQPHDQHQERRRRFLKKSGLLSVSNGLLSVSNGLLSVSNGHLTRNKSLLRFCVIKWEWKIST